MKQCKLLKLSGSSVYYQSVEVLQEDLTLMREMDAIHLRYPFFGRRWIKTELGDRGFLVNRKKVQRLMRKIGILALYPKKQTSLQRGGHKIYPYLLKDLTIDRPNQVWATDITYIPMAKVFLYCAIIIDWCSRKVLSWRLPNTMDTRWCSRKLSIPMADLTLIRTRVRNLPVAHSRESWKITE